MLLHSGGLAFCGCGDVYGDARDLEWFFVEIAGVILM